MANPDNTAVGLPNRLASQNDQLASQATEPRIHWKDRLQADKGLAHLMEESFWKAIPWQRALTDVACDQELVFQVYGQSIVDLETVHQETIRFLEQVWETNREFRAEGPINPEARAKTLQAERDRLSQLIQWPAQPPDKVFNVHLTNSSLDSIIALLSEELRRRIASMVRQFLECCVRLVEKEVLGLIEWVNPSACELYFFRRVIIQGQHKKEIKEGQKKVQQIQGGMKIVTSRTEVISGEHEIRQARHEHHLHQASESPLDDAKAPIPQDFQPLVRAIPGWLKPWMRLVTGVQFRGRILEIEVGRERWQQSQQISPIEEYRIAIDPVIVLGPFVFSGWDDTHMEVENGRLDSEEKEKQNQDVADLNARLLKRGGILLLLWQLFALVLVGAGAVHGTGFLLAGIGMAIVGLGLALGLARFDALIREKKTGPGFYAAVFFSAASAIAGSQVLAIGIVKELPGFTVLGIVCLAIALRFFVEVKKLRSI